MNNVYNSNSCYMFYLTCIVMAMLCVCCISKRVHSRQSNWRHSTSSMALWRTMTSTYGTLYLMTLMALPIERSIVSIHRTHVDCPYHLNLKNAVNMMATTRRSYSRCRRPRSWMTCSTCVIQPKLTSSSTLHRQRYKLFGCGEVSNWTVFKNSKHCLLGGWLDIVCLRN